MNVTLALDDELVATVRKVAIDQRTTMNAMIRAYLEQVAEQERQSRTRHVREIQAIWDAGAYASAAKRPTRDELHER